MESSKRNDRPQLAAAMAPGQEAQGHLAGGQVHRLSRSVAFISTLMESKGFDLAIADVPGANRLTLHVLAAVAEHERHMIGERTRHALAAAKDRRKTARRRGRACTPAPRRLSASRGSSKRVALLRQERVA